MAAQDIIKCVVNGRTQVHHKGRTYSTGETITGPRALIEFWQRNSWVTVVKGSTSSIGEVGDK